MTSFSRLPAPMGLLIDRDQPLNFSFDGKPYQGLQGDSIASALLANGRWLLSRSFKYHRPRGPLTMAGQDANTLVQLPDEPNVLADAHSLAAGLSVNEVAERCGRSPKTISRQKAEAKRKLGLQNNQELFDYLQTRRG